MNKFIDVMSRDNARTFNDGVTNQSSNSGLIDLLFLGGASRSVDERDVLTIFTEAYKEDRVMAKRLLFYIRDIEEGLGERRFFRVCSKYLVKIEDAGFIKSLLNIETFRKNITRVDDIIYLISESIKYNGSYLFIDSAIKFLFNVLLKDDDIKGIAAKWMPRKNSQFGNVVKFMRKNGYIKTYSSYRRLISFLSNTVEQKMAANEWDEINLEHVPSLAMKKYKKSFKKRELLEPYIKKVEAGKAKLNASKLFPNQIVKEIIDNSYRTWGVIEDLKLSDVESRLLNEQWKNLKKLNKDLNAEFRALPVIDVSGSMTSPNNIPLSMSIGLGMFIAENNPSKAFKDYFVTFSNTPQFNKIKGHDLVSKVLNLMKADWGMNTNLEATIELVLERAIMFDIVADDMPTHLIIISDMEFDACARYDESVFKMINRRFEEAGYKMPSIVFWNVNGRVGNVPVNKRDKGVLLVSGASQNVVNFILKKSYDDLMGLVREVVDSERYSYIN